MRIISTQSKLAVRRGDAMEEAVAFELFRSRLIRRLRLP